MKKIRLNDRVCLTDRFLEGRISLVLDMAIDPSGKDSVSRLGDYWQFGDGTRVHCRFAEGDALPVMMSYRRAGLDMAVFGKHAGWEDGKKADPKYLPHKLVVEGVRCVRAWDITEEDALRCGMIRNSGGYYLAGGSCGGAERDWKKMFARLFDKMLGVPYSSNPWVVAYEMTPVVARKL